MCYCNKMSCSKVLLLKCVHLSLWDWGERITSLSKERAKGREAHHEGGWLWKTEGLCLHLLTYVTGKVPPLSLNKTSCCLRHLFRNHPAQPGKQFTAALGSHMEMTKEFRTGNEWCHYAQFPLHRNFGRQIVNTPSTTGSLDYQAWSWKAPWILPSVKAHQWHLPPRYLSI